MDQNLPHETTTLHIYASQSQLKRFIVANISPCKTYSEWGHLLYTGQGDTAVYTSQNTMNINQEYTKLGTLGFQQNYMT